MKILVLNLSLLLVLLACKGQSSVRNGEQKIDSANTGIVYFSTDNGQSWKNASRGLPQNVKIALGGISTSDSSLALATKENGVYIYHDSDSSWHALATDQEIIEGNIGGLISYKNMLYIGTQNNGVYCKSKNSFLWKKVNEGLKNLTIRRFFINNDKLYACTNDGFYGFDELKNEWILLYGEAGFQVNGATFFKDDFYLATNRGIFKSNKVNKWENVMPNNSVHNISSDDQQLNGMTYTSLLLSSSDGKNWKSLQEGLPKGLYTFNVLTQSGLSFAGQWDGIYVKTPFETQWRYSSNGLPSKFAATNLKSFNGMLIISTSERILK